ncbi:MAG TPA: hypothetical protein VHW00_19675 [Thermoanaerobaculia bacterium]|nr:hypothetical protein [Thermoanaerobaculia bacterium]
MPRLFLFVLACAVLACSPAKEEAPSETASRAADVAVAKPSTPNAPSPEEVVEEFGRRLKNVPLTAAPHIAAAAIRQHYDGLVTPALLERWASAPAEAPGREVSSPWPDRIEVNDTERNGDRARVDGTLVEVTSTGDARRLRVEARLERSNERWRISAFEATPETAATPREPSESNDSDAAVAIVRAYYDAINAGDFDAAYDFWGTTGPPDQDRATFVRGFENTKSVQVTTGAPSRIEGAAGSRYIDVPVTIVATTKSGNVQRFSGSYTLRRSVVDGATARERRWHLYRASIRERRGA